MPGPLADKIALVTGASRGIGRAIAMRLARDGALVAVHYGASGDAAGEVVDAIRAGGGRAFALQADLARVDAIRAMFDTLDAELARQGSRGVIDILVNNAGIGLSASFDQTTEADFDRVFDTNVKGLFFVCQQALPRLADGGCVVNVSSLTARGAGPSFPAYAASKTAVNALTLALASHLGPRRIRVNAIMPGYTDTDFVARLKQVPGMLDTIVKQTALGRPGLPEDMANAVALLLSPDAGWITGQVIETTGGARL
ncbi:MAG: SDR family oxidoreductase [Gammaproteobacteria bacterium]